MKKSARKMRSKLVIGEIISIRSRLGLLPAGLYRIDGVINDLLLLSAGDTRTGVTRDAIEILARHQPEPASWEEREIEILEFNACDCAECRKLLEQKKVAIKSEIVANTHQ